MNRLYFWSSRIALGAFLGNILSVLALYSLSYGAEGCEAFVQLPVATLFESVQILGLACGVLAVGAFFVWLFALVLTRVSKIQQNLYLGLLILAPFIAFFFVPLRVFFMLPFLLLVFGDPCFDID